MNLTHAAALALAGWYLMVARSVGPYHRLDHAAPISRWTHSELRHSDSR
jgi:hypothetical protein